MVVTEPRLEQGATAVGGFDKKLTGKFVEWLKADVKKETLVEMEAAKLTWDQVEKAITSKARSWYLAKS